MKCEIEKLSLAERLMADLVGVFQSERYQKLSRRGSRKILGNKLSWTLTLDKI